MTVQLAPLQGDHQLGGGEKVCHGTVQGELHPLQLLDEDVRGDVLVPRGIERDSIDRNALVEVEES